MSYFYEAIDASGQTVVGKLDAVDEVDVHNQLAGMGLRAVSIAANRGVSIGEPIRRSLAPDDLGSDTPAPLASTAAIYAGPGDRPGAPRNASPPAFAGPGDVTRSIRPVAAAPMAAAGVGAAAAGPRAASITLAGDAARTLPRAAAGRLARPTAPQPLPAQQPVSTGGLAGVNTRELMFFFQQLSALVHSGVSIYSALDTLAQRATNRHLRLVTHQMAEQARTGGAISEVMAHHPRIFPEHVIGLVRAGEHGGFVEAALGEIALTFERNVALYRWSWIPKVMAVQALFVLAIAQPVFPTLFPDAEFALYARLLLFRNLPLACGVLAAIVIASRRMQLPQHRLFRDRLSLRMRPFGELQRLSAVATFLGTLKRLYQAGVSPALAWEGAANTASNAAIRAQFVAAQHRVQAGASIPEAFAATGLFNNSVEQMVMTGHESGQMVEMLEQAEQYYREQADDMAGKARFMMLRLGVMAMIVLGGAALIWLEYSYYHGIFGFVEKNFGE